MASTIFDFETYLASICPGEQFSISVLEGGLVNVTVRALRVSSALETSLSELADKESFIMKYAPAYIAALGKSAPFSQYRQARDTHVWFLTVDY